MTSSTGPDKRSLPASALVASRLNNDATSFDRTAENLSRTAQIQMSGELVRKTVLAERRRILAAQAAIAGLLLFHEPLSYALFSGVLVTGAGLLMMKRLSP